MAKGQGNYTFPKTERLHSNKQIAWLFGTNGSKSMSAYPLRMVYKVTPAAAQDSSGQPCPRSQVMISVPKRCLHRANKRNLAKRQIREAYRKNKNILEGLNLTMALIWLDNKTYDSATVERQVVNLLTRAKEKLQQG